MSNISITTAEQGATVNADAFTYADVCPVAAADESKPGEKAKKPVTLASVLHKTRKIANVAVEKTTVAASAAVVTAKELDAKHQISSTTMAAATSATEKTKSGVTSLWGKVVGGGEKKMEVCNNVGASESTVVPNATSPATSAPTNAPTMMKS
jgi:hypothetical protein